MPQIPRSTRLLKKAEAALLSALELYNKPDFKYREESFSILMLNAWELLLKAKLLHDAANDLRSLHVYESRTNRSGRPSRKQYLRRNRSGNAHTKSLGQVIVALDGSAPSRLSPQVRSISTPCRKCATTPYTTSTRAHSSPSRCFRSARLL
jgi:hypothetical protein